MMDMYELRSTSTSRQTQVSVGDPLDFLEFRRLKNPTIDEDDDCLIVAVEAVRQDIVESQPSEIEEDEEEGICEFYDSETNL